MRLIGPACIVALAFVASAPAKAHPHVWIDATAEIVIENGKMVGVRHVWTFDDMYSAFVTQGVGKDPENPTEEELQPIAKSNIEALPEFEYFTFIKADGSKAEFETPTVYSMSQNKDRMVTFKFTLSLKQPATVDKDFAFQVYDPSYFVAFTMEKQGAVSLAGAPDCAPKIITPQPLDADDRKKLDESAISGLSPGLDFGMKLAGHVVIQCR